MEAEVEAEAIKNSPLPHQWSEGQSEESKGQSVGSEGQSERSEG